MHTCPVCLEPCVAAVKTHPKCWQLYTFWRDSHDREDTAPHLWPADGGTWDGEREPAAA
jgi:hypothetical protein